MKELVLVRHAKSSWEHPLPDMDRPLSQRGITDIALVAHHFQQKNEVPNVVYSSPANRALTTSKLFLKTCGISSERIQIESQLYDFGGNKVLQFIKQLPNSINSVMLFGHNEAFTALTNSLGNSYLDNLPTSGLVNISFSTKHWEDIITGSTNFIITPKGLK